MFGHLPAVSYDDPQSSPVDDDIPPWLKDVRASIGNVGTQWMLRQQASIDAFYIMQKGVLVKTLGGVRNRLSVVLEKGSVLRRRLLPLREGLGRSVEEVRALTEEELNVLRKCVALIETWLADCECMFLRQSASRSGRPMVRVSDMAEGDDPVPKPAPGKIGDYVQILREQKTICQETCEAHRLNTAVGLEDDLSLLVMFGGSSVAQLLARGFSGMGLDAATIHEHLYSENPNSTMHCGNHMNSVHIGISDAGSVFPDVAVMFPKASSSTGDSQGFPAGGPIAVPHRFKDRTSGTTWQKILKRQRQGRVRQHLWRQGRIPLAGSDLQEVRVVDGVQVLACRRCSVAGEVVEEFRTRTMICRACGATETGGDMLAVSRDYDRVARPGRSQSCAYDPANHFRAWLDRVQAKESVFVPPEVIEAVQYEQAKHQVESDQMTVEMVRKFLQNRGFSQYYNNEYKILYMVAKIPPPVIHPDHERVLAMMFQDYMRAWPAVKPDRKNSLSYSFLLNRFCKIQNWTEYQTLFRLPLSERNQDRQQKIWKMICVHLDWPE
jgi:hypothetical protein